VRPDLAEAGRALLYQFGIDLAFLAPLHRDGGPRLHPVCPLIHGGHLFVFVMGHSPKCQDLLRDSRYALHTFLPAYNDDEFYCTESVRAITMSGNTARQSSTASHRHR